MTDPTLSAPWKSKAQRERCRKLVAEGKMKQEAWDRYEAATPNVDALPERLHEKRSRPADGETHSFRNGPGL
jgi:hypothetical protein